MVVNHYLFKMPRKRSPNFPQLTLAKAVERAWGCFDESNPVKSRLEMARLLGFSGLTSQSNLVISALIDYGILKKERVGHLVFDHSFSICRNPVSKEESKFFIFRNWAFKPQAFADSRKMWPMTMNEVMERFGFSEKGAAKALGIYRANLEAIEKWRKNATGHLRTDVGATLSEWKVWELPNLRFVTLRLSTDCKDEDVCAHLTGEFRKICSHFESQTVPTAVKMHENSAGK